DFNHRKLQSFATRRSSDLMELPLFGDFNVRNALAAIAIADAEGLSPTVIADALHEFKGVKRRMQLRGTAAGVSVYDDFAHHPSRSEEHTSEIHSRENL